MKLPIGKCEEVRRIEQEIARRQCAADTVLNRINRGNYHIHSSQARAIRRKYQRMVDKVLVLNRELLNKQKELRLA